MRTTLASAAIAIGCIALPTLAAPYTPSDDAVVLERLPIRSDPTLAELKRMQRELAIAPTDPARAVRVARRAIEAARRFGDPRFLGQARAALAPWWSLERAPSEVLVIRATIKQSLHDFEGALVDLTQVIASDAGNAQALLTRATVLTVLGRFDEAKRDCRALARRTDPLVATACLAAASSVSGDAEGAYRALDSALSVPTPHVPTRAWALTLAGEIATRRGDAAAAERHFTEALAVDAGDSYLKAAYADFLLDQGQAAKVVELLKNETKNDALLLRLTLAEMRLPEQQAFASHRKELAERFRAARQRGDTLHLREEARFALELERDPARALALARANWAQQRESADLRILAASALATGDSDAKRVVTDWITKTGYQDTRLALPRAETRP